MRNIRLLKNRAAGQGRDFGFSIFSDTSLKKVVSNLYGCRSAVAHGGDIKSAVETLNKMVDNDVSENFFWLHDWMRRLTKEVLLCALREPQLVNDLK